MRELGLEGQVTFSLGLDSFKLNIERIVNHRSGGESGTLWIKLWALRSPPTPGSLDGVILGDAKLDPLPGGDSIHFERTLSSAEITAGEYYPLVTLEERDSSAPSGWVPMDRVAFETAIFFGKLLRASGSSVTMEGDKATIRLDTLENLAPKATGPLRITAVTTPEPYTGGPIRGTRLGSHELPSLAARQSHRDVTYTVNAPAPQASVVLLFEERPANTGSWRLCAYWSGAVSGAERAEAVAELRLEDLIGQAAAKAKLTELIKLVAANEERKRRGFQSQEVSLHAVFTGSPGTGKTTFARFYGQEIRRLGILKRGHMVEVSRAQLVAEYEGQTASKTTKAVESAFGGVLFVDEAYSLKKKKDDSYGQECVDTLNKLMEDNRHRLAVVFAGYTEDMREFLRANEGLESRVDRSNVIPFADFTDAELGEILVSMCNQRGLAIDDDTRDAAMAEVARGRKGRSFGNAREVRNVLDRAVRLQAVRLGDVRQVSDEQLRTLEKHDFAPGSGSPQQSALEEVLDLVGLEAVKRDLRETGDLVQLERMVRKGGGLPSVPLHRLFVGAPGTGKRTVAKLYGAFLHEQGLLASGHVIEASRSDLIAGVVGETVNLTRGKLRDAMGGVLYLRDAPVLWRGAQFSYDHDAIEALLDAAASDGDRLALVFDGTVPDFEQLLAREPRIRQLFPPMLLFNDPTVDQLMEIAARIAKADEAILEEGARAELRARIDFARADRLTFSNAATVRELLQRAYRGRARRLVGRGDLARLPRDVLMTVEAGDFG